MLPMDRRQFLQLTGVLATTPGDPVTGAEYVINGSGAFFYRGTPAAGNLAVSLVPGTSSVTDPFGNIAEPGLTSYEGFGSGDVALNVQAGIIQWLEWSGSSWAIGAGLDWVPVNGFTELVNSPFRSLGGTASNPTLIITDSWNKPSSLSGGWTPGSPGFQYRLTPERQLHVAGLINSSAMTGAAFFTLPSPDYIPANGLDFPVAFHTPAGYAQAAFGRVSAAGVLSIINATRSTGLVILDAIIPLDLA
jgi:hypothetical protein